MFIATSWRDFYGTIVILRQHHSASSEEPLKILLKSIQNSTKRKQTTENLRSLSFNAQTNWSLENWGITRNFSEKSWPKAQWAFCTVNVHLNFARHFWWKSGEVQLRKLPHFKFLTQVIFLTFFSHFYFPFCIYLTVTIWREEVHLKILCKWMKIPFMTLCQCFYSSREVQQKRKEEGGGYWGEVTTNSSFFTRQKMDVQKHR